MQICGHTLAQHIWTGYPSIVPNASITGNELPDARTQRWSSGTIYTIGHSNHSLEEFLNLLRRYEIQVLVDVRSQPYSRFAPHFSAPALRVEVLKSGFKYVYLGKELGGRPQEPEYYDESGRVDYAMVAESAVFRSGCERLKNGAADYRVAILCAEENPAGCHRRLLVGRVLVAEGVDVLHIRGDGSLTSETELDAAEHPVDQGNQLSLFGPEQYVRREWKSVHPIRVQHE